MSAKKNKKILLIEDDRVMRENTAELLELSGYSVATAENGKFGVEKAKADRPDLIICDVMMPELDGYGVLYLLSRDKETAGIPFIFLTAKAERADQRKGMELGADDYLTKPFEEDELIRAVEGRLKRMEHMTSGHSNDMQGLNAFIDEARAALELENLAKDRRVRKYNKRDIIFHEGDQASALYFVADGKVKTFKINEDGKEFVTGLHGPGDFIGYVALLTEKSYEWSAMALEDCELCIIPKADFISLVHRNQDVSVRFIKLLSNKLIDKEKQLIDLAYNSVRQRVAEALLQLCNKYRDQKSGSFSMNIPRNDLASLVGTATESLIRSLSDFKEEGIIVIKGSEIAVTDEKKLRHIAQHMH
jgi:CRP/FNR family cyclic AMP-dependent transcriptional regulator